MQIITKKDFKRHSTDWGAEPPSLLLAPLYSPPVLEAEPDSVGAQPCSGGAQPGSGGAQPGSGAPSHVRGRSTTSGAHASSRGPPQVCARSQGTRPGAQLRLSRPHRAHLGGVARSPACAPPLPGQRLPEEKRDSAPQGSPNGKRS